jgi:hypothetical protein
LCLFHCQGLERRLERLLDGDRRRFGVVGVVLWPAMDGVGCLRSAHRHPLIATARAKNDMACAGEPSRQQRRRKLPPALIRTSSMMMGRTKKLYRTAGLPPTQTNKNKGTPNFIWECLGHSRLRNS